MLKFAVVVAVSACAVAGCTATPESPTETAGGPGSSTATPSTIGSSPAASADVVRALELPDGFRTLVPVAEKSGNATLPAFTPTQGAYTLFTRCQGGGDLTVQYNNESDVDTWPCDGGLNRGRVYSNRKPQKLVIRVGRTATWSAGIVDGAA